MAADNPVAWWRVGELTGTTAVDATGQGHDGLYENAPTLGVVGAIANDTDTAVTFQGGQDVFINDPLDNAYNVASIAVELWLRTTSVASMGIIGRWNNNNGMVQFRMRMINGLLLWQVQTLSGGACAGGAIVTATTAVNDGTYHYVAATFDAPTHVSRIFLDGVENVSGTADGTSLCDLSTFAVFRIAAVPLNFDSAFDGTLDDVALYAAALDPSRILVHYHAGTGQ